MSTPSEFKFWDCSLSKISELVFCVPFVIIGLITGLKLFQDEPEDALIASVEPYSPWNWISGGKLQ